jgi:RHS repeat-associated protein
MIRNATRVLAALAASLTVAGVAHAAAPFQDVLVQPPSIGDPQRGSVAGSLSKLAFGPADLARGAYSLPLPIEVPGERGALLTQAFPSYSAEGSLSEWGAGWSSDLAIRRHRVLGDLDYATDGFTSPWGRLEKGDDGAYYPAGMRATVRVRQVAGGWEAITGDGTIYTFLAADAVHVADGDYAWMLSRVDSLLGDLTTLGWVKNDSGRAFLDSLRWGGRHDGTQYQAQLVYETLAKPFASYASGSKLLLDRRVTRVVVSAKHRLGGAYTERWHYDLGYTTSTLGPAFYLTSVTRTFASGQAEPAVTYDYDMGAEQLQSAQLVHDPALDLYLTASGGLGIQPDHSSMTDLEQNGLTDIEHYYSNTMVVQGENGFEMQPLPAKTGAENPLCRPDPSVLNKPRMLARMRDDTLEPQVVVARKVGIGASTSITFCDRIGMTQQVVSVPGNWELAANVRLADLDIDHRPDFVATSPGKVQVLANVTTAAGYAFLPLPQQSLFPVITPAMTWVLDFNGDGKPDLMERTASSLVVWLGKGHDKFEPIGTQFSLYNVAGQQVSNLGDYQISHGDFNGDGLSDIILSKGQTAAVFLDQGDRFTQRLVPGLASVPWSFGFPLVADLTASGNPQVVLVNGTKAMAIDLATPSTGLLRKADDGKGTIARFGYRRAKPEPGIVYRYALLDSLTLESSGYEPVTYHYSYAHPVWHSVGRYLVGFTQATKQSPFFTEDVQFHNDDDIAAVIEGTSARDTRTPGVEKFTANSFESASYHGLPWRRPTASESGLRDGSGAPPLSTRTTFEAYERGVCPVRVATTMPGGTLTKEETLASVAALDDDLHCLPSAQALHGRHDDASLDFDYGVSIVRNDLGQVVSVAQSGPQGQLVLQENGYDAASARMISSSAPGRGATTMSYDAQGGELARITSPDGTIMTVGGFDPLSDALLELDQDRGGGVVTRTNYAYDGLERLERRWDNVSGSSPARPSESLRYNFATATRPGRIDSVKLIDGVSGLTRTSVDLEAADGTPMATATWAGAWLITGLHKDDRNELSSSRFLRLPIGGAGALETLSWQDLFGTDTSELSVSKTAGFGYALESRAQVQAGVQGGATTSWLRQGDTMVERTVQNGSFVHEVAKDAAGRVVSSTDEKGVVQRYSYDVLGRLIRVVTPDAAHRLQFDAYGRPARVVRDGVATVEYGYDANGLPTAKRFETPGGQLVRETQTDFDAIGRVSHVEHRLAADGSTHDFWFDYDGVGADGTSATAPGQKGQLSRVRGDAYERRTLADAGGRPVRRTLRLGTGIGWRQLVTESSYRADGSEATNQLTILDAAGHTWLHSAREDQLDAYGRPYRRLVDGIELYRLSYDGEGRIARADLADGHALVLSYDPVTHARRGYRLEGPVQDGGVSWDKDARGLIVGETVSHDGQDRQRSYAYDARGFLTGSSDGSETSSYDYTDSGLPDSVTDASGARHVRRSGSQLGVGSVTYQWDELGRVVAKGDLTLAYGASGEIDVAHKGARELRYFYDDAGQRVLKLVDGVPSAAYVGGSLLTNERFVEPVVVAGVTVGVLENGVFIALLTDPRGTPVLDENGASYLASPYGMRLVHGDFAEAIDFAKLGYDADLGTVRMGVRDYDALLSQFWTPDPLFLESLEKCQSSPVECSLYGYAKNNPLSFTDPTGTEGKKPYYAKKHRPKVSHDVTAGDKTQTPVDKNDAEFTTWSKITDVAVPLDRSQRKLGESGSIKAIKLSLVVGEHVGNILESMGPRSRSQMSPSFRMDAPDGTSFEGKLVVAGRRLRPIYENKLEHKESTSSGRTSTQGGDDGYKQNGSTTGKLSAGIDLEVVTLGADLEATSGYESSHGTNWSEQQTTGAGTDWTEQVDIPISEEADNVYLQWTMVVDGVTIEGYTDVTRIVMLHQANLAKE